jgi:hypothetical protein
MSVHRNIIPNYSQQDATLQYLYKKAELIAFSELSDNILIVVN